MDVLNDLSAFDPNDAQEDSLKAAILRATALIRSGDVPAGTREIGRVLDTASDRSIVAQATIVLALAHLQLGNLDDARARLYAAPVTFDAVGVRLWDYRGLIALYEGRYDDAVASWKSALELAVRTGAPLDQFVLAGITVSLCSIAAERLDAQLWNYASQWADRLSYLQRPSVEAYRLHYQRSVWLAVHGKPADALDAARKAQALAPTPLTRLSARCRRAAILFRYGERLAYADITASIQRDFAKLKATDAVGGDAGATCEVAETLALLGEAEAAQCALATQSPERVALPSPLERVNDLYVQSLIADAAGETLRARHLLEKTFMMSQQLGLTRRALMSAIPLCEMRGLAAARQFAGQVSRTLPPASWVRVQLRFADRSAQREPVQLNRAQREVLDMLLRGMSTSEIAVARRRAEGTTRNTISTLLRAFGVTTRHELMHEYLQPRLVAPGNERRRRSYRVGGPSSRPGRAQTLAPSAGDAPPRAPGRRSPVSDAADLEKLKRQARDAVWTHNAWVNILGHAIATQTSPYDLATVADATACPIGVWLADSLSRQLRQSILYEVTVRAHERFHQEATAVLIDALRPNTASAQARMERGGSFYEAAAEVRSALAAWEDLAAT